MEENQINLAFIYILATHTCTHNFSLRNPWVREWEWKSLNFSFKYACRFYSNLMTQDLAPYLGLMLQDFILILNKCSHTGTENKTGKGCLSFPLCCYYMPFKCTDCSFQQCRSLCSRLLFFSYLGLSLTALHLNEEHASLTDIYLGC